MIRFAALTLATLLSSIAFLKVASASPSTTEACVVMQVSGNRVSSTSYDLLLSKTVEVKSDLVKGINITLNENSGWLGTGAENFETVTAKLIDVNHGTVVSSLIRLNRAEGDSQVESNLSTLRYQVDSANRVEVTCTQFLR